MNKRPQLALSAAAAACLALTACSGGGFDDGDAGQTASGDSSDGLTVMIGSSGPTETELVQATTAAFTEETGIPVTVIPAQDLTQQLGQGFAGGNPPDLFYVDPARVGLYAQAGNLYPYGDDVDLSDYDPTTLQSYTIDGVVQCVPKEAAGVLVLTINTTMWAEAGLTEDDYPTTWEELRTVAQTLTTDDHVGLSFGPTRDRVGAFMVGAGGWFVNDDYTEVTADSPENLEALTFLQGMLQDGSFAWSGELGAGWGGEAFGTQAAAMTVEGGWIDSVLASDYPDVEYTTISMPAGPDGIGTLNFSNCWGVAAQSEDTDAAVRLVEFFNSDAEAKRASEVMGTTPARLSLQEWAVTTYPEQAIYLEHLDRSKGQVPVPGFDSVLADFDSKIEGLEDADPAEILSSLQSNGTAVLESNAS